MDNISPGASQELTSADWQLVKQIVADALDLAPPERRSFLDRACNGDLRLRAEVESLVDSHDRAGKFIEVPARTSVPARKVPDQLGQGTELGCYRIVQLIDEGGMGTVYQAVRIDGVYRKLVAIKVVRSGMSNELARKRFDTERQILAHLDHPNIAKLLDGGTTPGGLPYFVMDFIAGRRIDEYCDARKMPVRERLELFLTVCSAVQYAHQNLIVHRDLKPQNILVNEEDCVKLLDFGIARIVDQEPEENRTATMFRAMTPLYASPEQLNGDGVTTATDIYSLGVILYELLTGRHPHAGKTRSSRDLHQAVNSSIPRRPSTVIAAPAEQVPIKPTAEDAQVTPEMVAEARSVRQERLARQLSGDLDNILLMALRKEPDRRYASVEQFSNDIRRHLQGRPVLARADTLTYRASRFTRRHRFGVAALALFVFTLIGGIIATAREVRIARVERRRAEARFNEVRGLARSVLFDLHDAIQPLPGSTQARELLVTTAKRYLDNLAGEAASDPTLQRERALAYERIGDVLGLPTQANLGKTGEALENYKKALAIERSLADADPGNPDVQLDIARAYNRICSVYQSSGKFNDSLQACLEAERIQKGVVSQRPNDIAVRGTVAATLQNLAGAYSSLGDWKNAEEQRQKALREFEDLHRLAPNDLPIEFERGVAYHRLAGLQEQLKDYAGARKNALQAISIFDHLSESHPKDMRARVDTTFALQRLGSILISMDDLPGALQAFRRALPIREQLHAMDPHDARAWLNLANSHAAVGFTLLKMNRASEALAHFRAQLEISGSLSQTDSERVEYQNSYAEALENVARVETAFAGSSRSQAEKIRHFEAARGSLVSAIDVYNRQASRNAIPAEYAAVPGRLREQLSAAEHSLSQARSGE